MKNIQTEIMRVRSEKRKGADKRSIVTDGAIKLSREYGLHGWTFGQLAEISKVPLGNMYYYFKSKSELLEIIASEFDSYSDTMLKDSELMREKLEIECELFRRTIPINDDEGDL